MRRIRRTTAVLAAVLAFFALPATAGAQCRDHLADCDPQEQDSSYVVPMEIRKISALLDVKDTAKARSLYAWLVPDGYEVPDEPAVGLYLIHIESPTENPLPDNQYSRWMEGSLAIRVTHPDEGPGWYHLAMPVDSPFEFDLGRAVGWPKYMAQMDMQETDSGWTAGARVKDVPRMQMGWVGGEGEPAGEQVAFAQQHDPFYSLNPTLEGPAKIWERITPLPLVPADQLAGADLPGDVPPVTELEAPQAGTVRYDLHPDLNSLDAASPSPLPDLLLPSENLADLVELRGEVPGTFWHAQEYILLQNRELPGEGGYGQRSADAGSDGDDAVGAPDGGGETAAVDDGGGAGLPATGGGAALAGLALVLTAVFSHRRRSGDSATLLRRGRSKGAGSRWLSSSSDSREPPVATAGGTAPEDGALSGGRSAT